MRYVAVGAASFVVGFTIGVLYRHFCEDRCLRVLRRINARWIDKGAEAGVRRPDIPVVSWGTILLAVAVVFIGFTYWLDHQRWDDYLDCQDDFAAATVPRQVAAADLNRVQTRVNVSQAQLNAALNEVVAAFTAGGDQQTPAQQHRAQEAFADLGREADAAARASARLVTRQQAYDRVIAANPLPTCGGSPG